MTHNPPIVYGEEALLAIMHLKDHGEHRLCSYCGANVPPRANGKWRKTCPKCSRREGPPQQKHRTHASGDHPRTKRKDHPAESKLSRAHLLAQADWDSQLRDWQEDDA